MKYETLKLIALAAVGLAFEMTVAGRVEVLFLLACFAALFARDPKQGLATAWIIGLFKDLGSANPLGLHAFLFLAAAWALLHLRPFVFREHPLTQVLVVFSGVVVVDVLVAVFVSIFVGGLPFVTIVVKTLGAALFTSLLAPVVIGAFSRIRWLVR